MNKKLIALAQAGKVAVVNDGTNEELNLVLNELISPNRNWIGAWKYYWVVIGIDGNWNASDTAPSLPCHSVREFLQDEEGQWEPKWGERVMWCGDRLVTYVAKDPRYDGNSIVIEDNMLLFVLTSSLSRITPKRLITRAEIKEKLGIEGEWEIVD